MTRYTHDSLRASPAQRADWRATLVIELVALQLIVGACAIRNSNSTVPGDRRDALPVRTARGVPARLEPVSAELRLTDGDTIAGPGCVSPMKDPRYADELRFIYSRTIGDYEIPPGRYGSNPGEVLRIECNTGRVIGLVRR
jgi:hypothetical protein